MNKSKHLKITCEKSYIDFPFAHRQPSHKGHCRFVHGHNWSIKFVFEAEKLDECGFVIDFGKLKFLKQWLDNMFDHTTVLNSDDPMIDYFKTDRVSSPGNPAPKQSLGLYDLRLVDDCSCEGLAVYILEEAHLLVKRATDMRCGVQSVTLLEDSKNSATVSW